MRAALRSRSFATLLAGYTCSAIGDGMAAVAISWLAIELSRGRDTGLLVGAAVAAYSVPGVVARLGLGRLLTRWDPRLLVLAEAALRAVSLGLVAAGAATVLLTPAGYLALLGVSSLLGLLGVTGALTSVAELLPEAQRVAGNSLITLTSFAATIIGPALAGGQRSEPDGHGVAAAERNQAGPPAGGLVYGPFQPIKQTIIQRHSPPGQLAALAAASGLLTVPAAPLGTALGGPLVAAIGPSGTLLGSGIATVALAGVVAAVLVIRRAAAAEPSTRPP